MYARRLRMFGIGTVAALAVGLWQAETAKADDCGRRGYGGSYYSSSYYSDYGGCSPVYVAPPCYPIRTYYSQSYYYPRPVYSGASFSFSYGRSHGHGHGHHRSYSSGHGRGGHRGWDGGGGHAHRSGHRR